MINNGKIMPISEGLDWKTLGIPYIVLYKKLDLLNYYLINYINIKLLNLKSI